MKLGATILHMILLMFIVLKYTRILVNYKISNFYC